MAKARPHPIRNAVIAGLIVAAILWACSLIPGMWATIWGVARAVCVWLGSSLSVSAWFFLLLCLGSLAFVVFATLAVIASLLATASTEYTTDTFFGLKWRWQYERGHVVSICCFCPTCDLQLHPSDMSTYEVVPVIGFRCDDCNTLVCAFEMSYQKLEDRVERSIHKKLRSGEWRTCIGK